MTAEDQEDVLAMLKVLIQERKRYQEALEWIASSDMECGDCMHCAKHALDGEG